MTRRWMAALAASVLLAAASHAARAEAAKAQPKPDNEFANRLYATDVTKQKKTYACFVREYDSAHLAKHPAQKVAAMKLLATADQVPEDENINHSFSLGGSATGPGTSGRVAAAATPKSPKARTARSISTATSNVTAAVLMWNLRPMPKPQSSA